MSQSKGKRQQVWPDEGVRQAVGRSRSGGQFLHQMLPPAGRPGQKSIDLPGPISGQQVAERQKCVCVRARGGSLAVTSQAFHREISDRPRHVSHNHVPSNDFYRQKPSKILFTSLGYWVQRGKTSRQRRLETANASRRDQRGTNPSEQYQSFILKM